MVMTPFPRHVLYNTLFGVYQSPVPGYNYSVLQATPQPDNFTVLFAKYGGQFLGLQQQLVYNFLLFRIPENGLAKKEKAGCKVVWLHKANTTDMRIME